MFFNLKIYFLFFLTLKDVGCLQTMQNKKKDRLGNLHQTNQPYIIIIGEPTTCHQIYISFDDEKFAVESLSKAIDACFKLYLVFNAQYPQESIHIWTFIQKWFYQIHAKSDRYNKSVNCLIKNLE
jgi:hypothetical protein